ncbi:MAG: purine-nucleoside phosphorylase [Chitinophagaceae bacterium]
MSVHINASEEQIAPTVLMPGDPLRAKFIAEKYLENPILVSETRNVFFYTGDYQGVKLTIGASGMGCPSIGIYSYELYTQYKVDTIIRIGTCGSYTSDLKFYDIINVEKAASESTYAKYAWGFDEEVQENQGGIFQKINEVALQINQPLITGTIHSTDVFYSANKSSHAIVDKYVCLAAEMESFALFANARYLNKKAACLLTVTDIIPTHERPSSKERETALLPMMQLALKTANQ